MLSDVMCRLACEDVCRDNNGNKTKSVVDVWYVPSFKLLLENQGFAHSLVVGNEFYICYAYVSSVFPVFRFGGRIN